MAEHDPLSGYPLMMTVEQVAEVIQVRPRTLYAWRQEGGGPPFVRLGEGRGSSIRYPREGLRKYLSDRTKSLEVTA
jgi:predicted site-specific integrase-resolvase